MDTTQRQQREDIYTRVTNEIIFAIEQGATDYRMPWHVPAGTGLPRNSATGKKYRGINVLVLWSAAAARGYASSKWASYLQWQSLGAQVRNGERGVAIVFYKPVGEVVARDNDEVEPHDHPRAVLRFSAVFNSEQVEGWNTQGGSDGTDEGGLSKVDSFIEALGSDIRYGGDAAYYSPAHDRIFMPSREHFVDTSSGTAADGFYATLLHEHVHWSGHPSRLNRDLSGKFGTCSYAMEELVAEFGAAFLCATLGISAEPRLDHSGYVSSWLQVLKEQKSAIFFATGLAAKASQFLEDMATE